MKERTRNWGLVAVALCGLLAACTSEESGDDTGAAGSPALAGAGIGSSAGASGSSAGVAGSTGGSGSGAAELCVNEGEPALDCPQKAPVTGACAPHGECCRRKSNSTAIESSAPDAVAVVEYRVNFSRTSNHPLTLGSDAVAADSVVRAESEEQSLLFRFEGPRAGGEEVSGPGTATVGQGRYNCDGTYSFYGETAAPPGAQSSDPARWAADVLPLTVDASKTGPDRARVKFADNTDRQLAYTPFVDRQTFALSWELVTQGFTFTQIDTTGPGHDCMGARESGAWTAGARFETYMPVAQNDDVLIPTITQSMCQLVAFGVLAEGMKDKTCTDPRCMPGSAECAWLKLPDSLCPSDASEMAMWGCHLGANGNPNAEADYPAELECSDAAPTGTLDPDLDPNVPTGQCCDPLGQSTTLPACNAYRLVQDIVAAAAEITDEPSNQLQALCP